MHRVLCNQGYVVLHGGASLRINPDRDVKYSPTSFPRKYFMNSAADLSKFRGNYTIILYKL